MCVGRNRRPTHGHTATWLFHRWSEIRRRRVQLVALRQSNLATKVLDQNPRDLDKMGSDASEKPHEAN